MRDIKPAQQTLRLKRYKKYLEKEARKFKLTNYDLLNLYDLFYMIDGETHDTLKLNKMDKWFEDFLERVERIVIPELYEENKQ